MWGTPPHPPARTSPLQPFPGFRRSDILACGRPSLVRYYALTEQVPLNLNTYESFLLDSLSYESPMPVAAGTPKYENCGRWLIEEFECLRCLETVPGSIHPHPRIGVWGMLSAE